MVDRGGMFVPLDSAGNGMSALDGRLALGGLIGTTARCISGGTITASTTNMVFTLARAVFQLPDLDNAGAVTLSALDPQALPAIPVGPTSGSRIDSIIVRQRIVGGSLSETSPYAVYAIVQGTASTGTPAAPTIPAGWYEYARVTVPTNASTASACNVQILYPATPAIGGLQAASIAALNLVPGTMVGQRGHVGDAEYRWNGTAWKLWNWANVPFATYAALTNSATLVDLNELSVTSGLATLHFNLAKSPGMNADTGYLALTAGFLPPATFHFAGTTEYQGGSKVAASIRIDSGGNLALNGNGGQSVDRLRGVTQFRLAA